MEDWPDWVRWLLFLPLLVLGCLAFGVLLRLGIYIRGESGWLVEVSVAAFMAWALFPMVFALAPRGQRIVGWVFAVLVVGFFGLMTLLMIGRGLGIAGLLPMLPAPEWAKWSSRDSIELGQGFAWTIVGSFSFRHSLRAHRAEQSRIPATASAH